jgi:hypothetical protein
VQEHSCCRARAEAQLSSMGSLFSEERLLDEQLAGLCRTLLFQTSSMGGWVQGKAPCHVLQVCSWLGRTKHTSVLYQVQPDFSSSHAPVIPSSALGLQPLAKVGATKQRRKMEQLDLAYPGMTSGYGRCCDLHMLPSDS